jgi:hypothetical protein
VYVWIKTLAVSFEKIRGKQQQLDRRFGFDRINEAIPMR